MNKMRLVLGLVAVLAVGSLAAACGGASEATSSTGETALASGGPVTLPEDAWTELDPSRGGPSARTGHAMAYDSSRDQVILFGGSEGLPGLNDTWAYDPAANKWTELTPQGDLPPGRAAHALVYDPVRDQVLMFGGGDLGGGLGDLWSYSPSANTWEQLSPAGETPGARGAVMVYDSAQDQVILFGGGTKAPGIDGNISTHGDTWAYDPGGDTWTDLAPTGDVPMPRQGHAMVYDPVSNRVILFGGFDGEDMLGDTWAYDPVANAWTQLASEGEAPTPRGMHSMDRDPGSGMLVLYGGMTLDTVFAETWAFDPATDTWALMQTDTAPTARANFSMAFDGRNGEFLLFGGFTAYGPEEVKLWDDIWAYRLPDVLPAATAAGDAEWVTFKGDSVSLDLPDTFVGGDPSDPAVLAVLDESGGSSGSRPDVEPYDLLMTEMSAGPGMPAYVQVFAPVLGSTPEMPDLLEQFVDATARSDLQATECTVDEVTADRAYLSVVASLGDPAGGVRQFMVLLRGDSYMCVVIYTFGDASDASMEDVFRRSAETIVIDI